MKLAVTGICADEASVNATLLLAWRLPRRSLRRSRGLQDGAASGATAQDGSAPSLRSAAGSFCNQRPLDGFGIACGPHHRASADVRAD
jgi:hypothetical protein